MISIKSPFEMPREIAKKAQDKRLKLNLSHKTLSDKSVVIYGSLKKFEQIIIRDLIIRDLIIRHPNN